MCLINKIANLEEEPGVYIIFGPVMSYRYIGSTANIREILIFQVNLLEKNEHPNKALQDLYNERKGWLDLHVQYSNDIESAAQLEYSIVNYPVGPQKLMNIPEVYENSIWNI